MNNRLVFCLILCFVIYFVACNNDSTNSNDGNDSKTDSIEVVANIQTNDSLMDTIAANDTVAVNSYSIADNKMLTPPQSISDYEPNERGIYEINWLTLTDIKFEEKIAAQDSALYLYPTFGQIVKSLDGKKVSIKGFIIPVDVETHYYVLSANPFSACFFCGKAGPESILELQLKANPSKAYELDAFRTFEGTFELNGTDVDHCNYILKKAVLVKE
ncbi:MAG: hypothetical protein R3E32_02180 [Chitinophagales bacterium]